MKNKLFKIASLVLLSVFLAGCASTGGGAKDIVVWEPEVPEDGEFTTITEYNQSPEINIKGGFKLKGYDYINIEICSPNSGEKVIGIDCFSIGEPGKGDTYLAQFASLLTPEYQVIQAPIMKDSGKTKLDIIRFYAVTLDERNLQEGVDIKVKRVVATNTRLTNPQDGDAIIYEATDSIGHKLTTFADRWTDFVLGPRYLDGYKYLNIELYSPNLGDTYIDIDGWGDGERVVEINGWAGNEPVVLQAPFGKNKGKWSDWDEENQVSVLRDTTTDVVGLLCVGALSLQTNELTAGVDIYIKKIWGTNTPLEDDRVLFKSASPEGYKIISTAGVPEGNNIQFGTIDLANYKYLNVEMYCPDSDMCLLGFDAWSWGFIEGDNDKLADFSAIILSEPKVYQVPFGMSKGYWIEWVDDQEKKWTIKDNELNEIFFFVNDPADDWNQVGGKSIYIKSIVATNKKLQNDASKDLIIYEAGPNAKNKFTTAKDWQGINVGNHDLEGYKYLNIELYSPNSGDHDIKLDAWGSERAAEFDVKLSSKPIVVQSLFGVNHGTWGDEVNGVWVTKPNTSNSFDNIAYGAHDGDNWDLIEGIDIYIKRIWATNTELTK